MCYTYLHHFIHVLNKENQSQLQHFHCVQSFTSRMYNVHQSCNLKLSVMIRDVGAKNAQVFTYGS